MRTAPHPAPGRLDGAMLSALLLSAPLVFLACDELRGLAVRAAPLRYASAEGPLRPSFEAVDGERRIAVRLVPVSQGHRELTDIQFPPGRSDWMLVLRKSGEVERVELSSGQARTLHRFEVPTASELGLLGLAFHPRWPEDPRVYVHRSTERGKALGGRLSEHRLDPETLTFTEERVLLEVEQPYGNHNAGQIAFGPDGRLYIGLGDGGWRDDPHDHGQNPATLLGAMWSLDVDAPAPTPRLWATGLRNPWRFGFDPAGRMVVADVGQDRWEEVSLVPEGANLGWNRREGRHCFPPDLNACASEGMTDPVFEYGRNAGQSVTGGQVQTAAEPAALRGLYLLGDFVTGRMWALRLPEQPGAPAEASSLGRWPLLISSFGRDGQGRVYVGDYGKGGVYRIEGAEGAGP